MLAYNYDALYKYFIFHSDSIILDCGTGSTLTSGSINVPVCPGDTIQLSCLTDSTSGFTRWVDGDQRLIILLDNTTSINNLIVTADKINFTLFKRNFTEDRKSIGYSTAVMVVINNLTVGCSDGNHAIFCNMTLISECQSYSRIIN